MGRRLNANSMIWYTSCLHIVWGICLFLDPVSHGITGLYLAWKTFPNVFLLGVVCFLAGLVAIYGTFVPRSPWQVFYLAPQQFLLFLSAVSSVHCVLEGSYADETPHPRVFIFSDQSPSLILLVFYSWAVFLAYQRSADAISDKVSSDAIRPN